MKTVALSQVAAIERSSVGPDEIEEGAAYVGLEHIESGGRILAPDLVTAGELKSNKFRFDTRHVLYGKLRPYLAKISAPSFAGICSTDILPLLPGPELDRQYLLHFLRTPGMISHASKLATGANLPRLSPKSLSQFEIPLPPIEEQRRIAEVLDAADALRAKRREALAKLDALTEAIFIDMFGTPEANIHGFPVLELGELVEVKGGKRLPKGADYAQGPSGWPYIRVTDFQSGAIETDNLRYLTPEIQRSISRYVVAAGDVIISIAGSIGQIASVPEELDGANLTENAAKLVRRVPASLTTEYLASFLRSGFAQQQISAKTGQVTIGKLALFRIASLNVLLPPAELQHRYEAALFPVRQSIHDMERSRVATEGLFASLQQSAFRGDL